MTGSQILPVTGLRLLLGVGPFRALEVSAAARARRFEFDLPRRSRLALTLCEREEISRGVAAGGSARRVAARLDRSPSTVTREIVRHSGRRRYRAADTDKRAWEGARRPQACKLARNRALSALVAAKLAEDWSPEQIAGWLKTRFPQDQTMRVSHETIYLTLFIQARGALKRELVAHLRRTRSIRRPRNAKRGNSGQGQRSAGGLPAVVPACSRAASRADLGGDNADRGRRHRASRIAGSAR